MPSAPFCGGLDRSLFWNQTLQIADWGTIWAQKMCEQWGDHQIQVSLHDEPGTIRCFDMWPCDHSTGGAPLKSAEQNQVKEFTCVKLGQKLALYPFAVHSKVGHAHIRTHTQKKKHKLFWHFCWRIYPQDSYKILQVPVAKVLGGIP